MSTPGNTHLSKQSLADAYGSDSTSVSGSSDVGDHNPHADSGEFRTSHWRKRRRTGKKARDNAALGVFGSDSEYEDGGYRRRHLSDTTLRTHRMGFVKAKVDDLSMGGSDDGHGSDGSDGTGSGEGEAETGKLAEEDLGTFPGLGLDASSTSPTVFKGFMEASLATGTLSSETSTGGSPNSNAVTSSASAFGIDRQGLGSTKRPPMVFKSPLGQGFVSSIAHQLQRDPVLASPPLQDTPPLVSPHPSFTNTAQQSRRIRGKREGAQSSVPDVNPNSFAARMMAKMGYVPGRGLGSQGQGILAPIEVKLRPQGVGVGAIREKTEQARAEARRAASLRGEVLSESESEKERKARKTKKSTGVKTKGASVASHKAKMSFRTVDEIEKLDLMVPSILKSVIDMTGPEVKELDPRHGLFIKAVPEAKKPSSEEEEKFKVARLARRNLEQFVTQCQRLQEEKTYLHQQEQRLTEDVYLQTAQIERLTLLLELTEKMKHVSIDAGIDGEDRSLSVGEYRMRRIVEQLETLQYQFKNEVEVYKLSELSIAAITPAFKQCMAVWVPLTDPFFLTELLRRLLGLLKVKSKESIEARYSKRGYLDQPSKTASPYESLIFNFWLPKVRSVINNQWDVHEPSPVLCLLEAWDSLLPSYILANILNHLVMPRLKTAIAEWNPRLESSSSRRKRLTATPPPHIWVFPWLPHLNTQTHLPSLLSDVKSKFSILLSSHPLDSGPIEGLPEWTELLGTSVIETIFIRRLLPRLASLLRSEFSVNPADQDLSALETVWRWKDGFKVSTLSQLLQAELFPKWLATLRLWLTTPGVLLGEVSEWYRFWQSIIPVDLRASPAVRSQFDRGLDMIKLATDLGPGSERARKGLPVPEEGHQSPIKIAAEEKREVEKKKRWREAKKGRDDEQVLFKDAIEDWCTENNLLLIPLRKADEKSGQPLFRITASVSGTGGVIVYLRNDVVWAQDKNITGAFEPVGLDNVLQRVGSNLGKMSL